MTVRGTYRIRFKAASRGRKRTFGGEVFRGEILDPYGHTPTRAAPWNAIGLMGLFVFLPLCATPLAILLIPVATVFFVLSFV
jgi:hypothetical protein